MSNGVMACPLCGDSGFIKVATRCKPEGEWVARMNDDTINAINCWRNGGYEMSLRCMNMNMPPTQMEEGGLSDIYRAEGTVRKSAYPILVAPNAAKLVVRFGRYHHKVDWSKLAPKLLHEKWVR